MRIIQRTGKHVNTLLIIFLLILSSKQLYTQTGQLSGTITNQETGEPLIGINLVLVGTNLGTSTDLDGKYLIRKIPPGTYSVRISGVGHATKVITGVFINGRPVELNGSMTEETYNLQEVIITADEIRSTESFILAQRKRSTSISDGISADQIKRTPDATSGDALKRVTGITVVENKFVFIRGVTDRYNETTLDGAPVSSTSVGKKSFSFDLIPSNLLENIDVVKSATPDLPGNFSGGIVRLNTLSFPNNQFVKLNISTSYNPNTTLKEILLSQNGKMDFLGFDDGLRKFPNQTDVMQNAILAPNTWAPRSTSAPLNSSFSLSIGDRFYIDKDDNFSDQLGYITALTYRNSYQTNDRIIDDWQVGRYNTGKKYENSILWGLLGNIGYKLNQLHKISFHNNFDQSAENLINNFHSLDHGNYQEKYYTTVHWNQRSIYTGQLMGEHELPALGGLSIHWHGALSSATRQDPDRKEITYYRNIDEPTEPLVAAVNQRSWAKLNERTTSLGIDMTYPISSIKIKVGSKAQRNSSNYNIRYFNVVPDYYGGIPDSLVTLPIETIYSPQNFGKGKFLFQESSKASDSYWGSNTLYAGFIMIDIPFEFFKNKFRFSGGTRLENSTQKVNVPKTMKPGGPLNEAQLKKIDMLPSMNLTYNFNEYTNLRLAYSQTVNRPELRELASTGFYDFIKYEIVGGNPNLQRALIKNLDLRIETFPIHGEIFAFSVFQKNILNAIEEQLIHTSTRTRTWFNSPKANVFGWEFEMRKTLGFLGNYFSNITITGNYSRIHSKVEFEHVEGNSTNTIRVIKTRPLQGQSPYVMNASILFREPNIGTSLNILYNKFGRRLETVGFLTGDIYEKPRDLIDLAVTQPITEALETKITVKNLSNNNRILSQENRTYEKTSYGRTYSLQVSYGF